MRRRILLVDDQPANLKVLEASLARLGHELIRAADGQSAIASFEASAPDLVLLDFVMPGLDGLDVLAHIRASKERAHTPVVLITAHSNREHRLRGLEAGADDFLEKPIDRAILVARVNMLLALKDSRDALQASRDELQRRHSALEDAQREHRELMEFIVHDLKNPLHVVHSALEWMQTQPAASSGELAEVITDASSASARLRTMIGNLLTISRMEQSTFLLEREAISLTKLIRSIIQSYGPRAEKGEIEILSPSDDNLVVTADRTILRRVLENILDNAFRYTPRRGRIAVATRPRNGVEITIANDGPPVSVEDRTRIFEKFKRGKDATDVEGSAGLGLYFCKRALEAHGGAIGVSQTPEWPTCFLIQLPA